MATPPMDQVMRIIVTPMCDVDTDTIDPPVTVEFYKGQSQEAFMFSFGPMSEVDGIVSEAKTVLEGIGFIPKGCLVGMATNPPPADVVDR